MSTNLKHPSFYVTVEELETLKQNAKHEKKTLSNYVRSKLDLPDSKYGGAYNKFGRKGKPGKKQGT